MIDFKISREVGTPDKITKQVVRFYEGEITTENEWDSENIFVPVTRYRRTALIEEVEYTYE